jgi:hypothetical protein
MAAAAAVAGGVAAVFLSGYRTWRAGGGLQAGGLKNDCAARSMP